MVNDAKAEMRWKFYWRDVVERYRVVLKGWLDTIPFANLSEVSSGAPALETLLRKLESGAIYWQSILEEEYADLNKQRNTDIENGVVAVPESRKQQSDKGTKKRAQKQSITPGARGVAVRPS